MFRKQLLKFNVQAVRIERPWPLGPGHTEAESRLKGCELVAVKILQLKRTCTKQGYCLFVFATCCVIFFTFVQSIAVAF